MLWAPWQVIGRGGDLGILPPGYINNMFHVLNLVLSMLANNLAF